MSERMTDERLAFFEQDEEINSGCIAANCTFELIEALKAEREKVEELEESLRDLLEDTQHKHHECSDDWCPVKRARQALNQQEEESS